MSLHRTLSTSLIAFVHLLLFSQPVAIADDLPAGVVNTQNPDHHSLTPTESLARITVPPDFNVTLFAGEPDIRRPIAFDFDDRGRLWVVENYSHPQWKADGTSDRVVILEDTNNDGRFDKRTVFYEKGRYLTGIAVGYGGVWLANTPELVFIPDNDRDDIPDSEPQAVLDGFQKSTNNVVNNLHWGPDGWLYGAIGLASRSLVGAPHFAADDEQNRTSITRGIWRYHPTRKVFETIAEGMVNPWGADFNQFGDLITANTVIAHLWHIVPGMYCERRASERDNPYAYRRIQTIAKHLHWGGGAWNESRNPSSQKNPKASDTSASSQREAAYHQHSVVGGGHAHCGGMVYLGDNMPQQYYGTFFTNNLHGNRVNNDLLQPSGSTYVGTHADDFLFGNDPWFRGMSIKYGPDGGVYISDWHDFGECHDSDGSHRTSGRIYKVVYDRPESVTFDLHQQTNAELVDLHRHSNAWFPRRARRILHERSLQNNNLKATVEQLWQLFDTNVEVTIKLRAIWTLHVLDQLAQTDKQRLLSHTNEHVRRWAVRFLVDHMGSDMSAPAAQRNRGVSDTVHLRLVEMASREPSPKVRMELACALQRLDLPQRLPLARALLTHQDSTDPYIPLMLWYGMEPAVVMDPAFALAVAIDSRIPIIRRFIARRLADQKDFDFGLIVATADAAGSSTKTYDLLAGMLDSLEGKGSRTAPKLWPGFYRKMAQSEDSELRAVALRLATIFGDQQAIAAVKQGMMETGASTAERVQAFNALAGLTNGITVSQLHDLVQSDQVLRSAALQELVVRSDASTADVLLQAISGFGNDHRQQSIAVLVSRKTAAQKLLAAISAGHIDSSDVSAFALQHLRSYSDEEIQSRVSKIWSDGIAFKKSEELQRLNSLMTTDYLTSGNASAGRIVFNNMCSKCHALFGEGGDIAPDLTGSGRRKADYVIRNLVDPNEEVDAAYRLTTVLTTDGRLLSGFVVKQDDTWLEMRTQDGRFRMKMRDVEELKTSRTSMMPEGMLRTLNDQQIRDLLVYLASDEQVALP